MIIYTDVVSGSELVSDTFNLVENKEFNVLWECNCRKYLKRGNEDFQLEGANPSAEDADEDEGGEGEAVMVHDIEDQFRLTWLKVEDGMKPSKGDYKLHMRNYLKTLQEQATRRIEAEKKEEEREEALKEWKGQVQGALKMILKNWDNYDVLVGESSDSEDPMYVLIDFREDGVTPYATLWKDGLKPIKV